MNNEAPKSIDQLQDKKVTLTNVLESQKKRHAAIGTGVFQEGVHSWEYDIKIGETREFARGSIEQVATKLSRVEEDIVTFSRPTPEALINQAQDISQS
jgi:hypothetical protein